MRNEHQIMGIQYQSRFFRSTPIDIDSISHIRYNLRSILVRNGLNSHHTLTVWTESPKKAAG
jgi:hypothetical protein